MASLPDLVKVAKKFDMKLVSIADLIEYRLKNDSLIERVIGVEMPTDFGDFDLIAFNEKATNQTHLALIKGKWTPEEPVLVRVHSSCVTGDIFGSCRCDCGPQLQAAMQAVEQEGQRNCTLYEPRRAWNWLNQQTPSLQIARKWFGYSRSQLEIRFHNGSTRLWNWGADSAGLGSFQNEIALQQS